MPGTQRVELYCLCWNDARMLPHFFRCYDGLVDQYFIYDNGSTDGSLEILARHPRVSVFHFETAGDSFVSEECRLGDTIWQGSKADWVIVTDIDEHIYHPNLLTYLRECTDEGVTAIQSIGYEMVSKTFPRLTKPLAEQVTRGARSIGHDRLCVFNPTAIEKTNFGPGRHTAKPGGRVHWPPYPQVLLLHFKQLGVNYLVARSAELMQGLRPRDIKEGWGAQYTWARKEIIANWKRLAELAVPVPGLGSLKDVAPDRYCEEERIIGLSGLVDEDWYLSIYPDVGSTNFNPVLHFCIHGWREGRKPNFYFETEWYLLTYPSDDARMQNPLYDYIVRAEKEDAWPSEHFNTGWYRALHGIPYEESPLRHYLLRKKTGQVSPTPEFDAVEYSRTHPEVLSACEDPFEHFSRHPGS